MSDAKFWADLDNRMLEHREWQIQESERLCNEVYREFIESLELNTVPRHAFDMSKGKSDWQKVRDRLHRRLRRLGQ